MKAIVYDAPRIFDYRDIAVPSIQPNEVIVTLGLFGFEF
jgi:hypothetical protein